MSVPLSLPMLVLAWVIGLFLNVSSECSAFEQNMRTIQVVLIGGAIGHNIAWARRQRGEPLPSGGRK
jgi:hypothetical protein